MWTYARDLEGDDSEEGRQKGGGWSGKPELNHVQRWCGGLNMLGPWEVALLGGVAC